ncbi:Quinone oxidoreductase [Ceratocystis lukuohia]|uniref:Quinone oxidoreductase n=1 Tax=Ceratocystis lukuohia TaxID=2019550 RepID=A0ABR4MCU8_9PEZI
MDDDNDGIFSIAILDDEETAQQTKDREARTALSEDAFQALRQTYEPKRENGEVVSKPEALAAVQAVEELYFYRRFEEAAQLAENIIAQRGGLDTETVELLRDYEARSRRRASVFSATSEG